MLKTINIKNFLTFKEFEIKKFTPVNIIIGPNDSGKTALLKLLYGVSKSLEDYSQKQGVIGNSYKRILSEKLFNTFQPRKSGLGELVTKGANEKLQVSLVYENKSREQLQFSFGESTTNSIVDCTETINTAAFSIDYNALFIPSKEVLTAFDAIALTREQYNMIGFDDTYYDLILDLRVPTQQGKITSELINVNKDLEDLFEGTIVQGNKENPFIFKKGKAEYTMPLTAEGIKKIGILTTLIRNRRLRKNTLLFMDEPETALHPKAVRSLAEMIVMMSNAGVQVFITSHNYFLIKQLAIIAKRDDTDISCVSLTKEKAYPVHYTVENMKNGLPQNPIIEEALAMFNEEIKNELGI
jgi:AAA15 family ATPase/GTPase